MGAESGGAGYGVNCETCAFQQTGWMQSFRAVGKLLSEGARVRLIIRFQHCAIHRKCHLARQPFIFPKTKTYPSPPMVGTPMQFP